MQGAHFVTEAVREDLEVKQKLFARLEDLKPAAPPRRLRSNFINGIKSLPVTFRAH